MTDSKYTIDQIKQMTTDRLVEYLGEADPAPKDSYVAICGLPKEVFSSELEVVEAILIDRLTPGPKTKWVVDKPNVLVYNEIDAGWISVGGLSGVLMPPRRKRCRYSHRDMLDFGQRCAERAIEETLSRTGVKEVPIEEGD